MAEYHLEHKISLNVSREITNFKTFLFFTAFMVVYVCVAIYAFITGDVKRFLHHEKTNNFVHKLFVMIMDKKWVLLCFFPFSILSTVVCLYLVRILSKFLMKLCLVLECIIFVIMAIVVGVYIFTGPLKFIPLLLMILAMYCWFSYARIYTVLKTGTEFMSLGVKQAVRAALHFPLAIVWSLFVTLLTFIVLTFGAFVFAYLSTMNNSQSITFTLVLLHCFNIFGTIWLTGTIFLFSQMVLYSTFSTWYWTTDKSTLKSGIPFKCITICSKYHIGTAAYGSSILALLPMVLLMIKNLRNHCTTSRHNIFVLIVCWWNIFLNLNHISVGITGSHGMSFKKSANKICQLYLRNPVVAFSNIMALQWCTGFLSGIINVIAAIISIAFLSPTENSIETLTLAQFLTQIGFLILFIPIVIIFNSAIVYIFISNVEHVVENNSNETIIHEMLYQDYQAYNSREA